MAMKHGSFHTHPNRAACTLPADTVSALHVSLYGYLTADAQSATDVHGLHQHGLRPAAIDHVTALVFYDLLKPVCGKPLFSAGAVIRVKNDVWKTGPIDPAIYMGLSV